jgi:ABC-type lipoprotein export system ATPase subunit
MHDGIRGTVYRSLWASQSGDLAIIKESQTELEESIQTLQDTVAQADKRFTAAGLDAGYDAVRPALSAYAEKAQKIVRSSAQNYQAAVNLLPEFDALENVCIPGWIANGSREQIKKRAIELLQLLGLADRIHHKPNELSGGEQQRVAVARALINEPLIVFADEPTGNLDSTNARALHELFTKINAEFGTTFLIVTHNEELAALSSKVLHMRDGLFA